MSKKFDNMQVFLFLDVKDASSNVYIHGFTGQVVIIIINNELIIKIHHSECFASSLAGHVTLHVRLAKQKCDSTFKPSRLKCLKKAPVP